MKKILIVEDNSDYREILNLFITKMGYLAITAKNSYEAIAFAEAEEPDLVFMDMQLPDGGSGSNERYERYERDKRKGRRWWRD